MRASWSSLLRSRLKPPRILTVTRVGRVYLGITVGIGVAALNTGNNLLYLLLGVLLGVIILSGVLSERLIWDLQVRRLVPDGAYAQEPFPLRYELRRGRGEAFGVEVRELSSELTASAFAPLVVAGEPLVVRADAIAQRRGPLRLGAVRVASRYPFGLFEKARDVQLDDLLVVFPRRGFTCDPAAAPQGATRGDAGSPRHRDGTGDVAGLRELLPFEDARRIHWKKSATAGKLLAVEREREERRQIVLCTETEEDRAELDRRCEATAAEAKVWLERGYEVGLAAGRGSVRPGAGPAQERRILTALAWLGFEPEAGP